MIGYIRGGQSGFYDGGQKLVGLFMDSKALNLSFISLAVVVLVACATGSAEREKGWPPVSSEIRDEFDRNQQGLETLSQRVGESNYSAVFRWGDDEVAAYEIDSEDHKMINLEDTLEWIDLFEDAHVDTVDRYSGQFSLHQRFEPTGIVDGTVFDHSFEKSDDPESTNCLPHYAESECGSCVERINDRWHVSLNWYPSEWLDGFEELDESDTEMTDHLYEQMQFRLESCMNRFSDEY